VRKYSSTAGSLAVFEWGVSSLMLLRRAGMYMYVDGEVEGLFHRFVVRNAVAAGTGRPVVMNVAHFLPMEF
jgi:hypothetical protein